MRDNKYYLAANMVHCLKDISDYYDVPMVITDFTKMVNAYPDEDNFDELIEYAGKIIGGVFTKISHTDHHEYELLLSWADNKWVVLKNITPVHNDCIFFHFIPDVSASSVQLSTLIELWVRKKSGVFSIFLVSFLLSLSALAIPLYMNAVYSRIIPASAESSLWTLSLLLISFFILEFVLKKKRAVILSEFIRDFSAFFEPKYIYSLASFSSSEKNNWGHDNQEAIGRLSQLRFLFWAVASSNIIDLLFSLVYIVVIAVIGKWLVLGVLAIVLLEIIFILFSDYKYKKELNDGIGGGGTLPIAFVDDYKANGMIEDFVSVYLSMSHSGNAFEYQKLKHRVNSGAVLGFLSSLQTIVIVILAYYLLQNGLVSSGALFATIILSGKVNQLVASAVSFLPLSRQIKGCFRKINAALLEKSNLASSFDRDMASKSNGWNVNNVSFSYDKDAQGSGVTNISFEILHGEKVAIVGANGAGKSTISKLLLGLLSPASGKISYRGENSPSKSVYYFPQKNFFYHETLFDYLGGKVVNQERLKSILSLPFLTWIGQFFKGGIYSSVRQSSQTLGADKLQMLEMARMALSEKKILVLDEPTAYVNANVELEFSKIVQSKLNADSTLILLTNRSNLLHLVDRVIFIDGGKIVFDGSVETFMSNKNSHPKKSS